LRKKVKWSHWSVLLALGVLAALVATAFTIRYFSLQHAPTGALFVPGQNEGWTAYGGTWKLIGNSIQNNSTERGAKFMKGSSHWRDYWLESDLESLGANGDFGLVVRSSKEDRGVDSYSGYYVGLREHDNSLIMGRSDYGWSEYAALKLRTVIEPFHWYHLKVVAVGCTIAAQFTDPATNARSSIAMKQAPSDCAESGRIGLRSVATRSAWRDIRANSATTSDLQPILEATSASKETIRPFGLQDILDEYKPADDSGDSAVDRLRVEDAEPISNLRLASAMGTDSVSVRGKVILTNPTLFIQDSTGGASVPDVETTNLNIGDEVLVQGKAAPHPFSSSIYNAQVTMLWPGGVDPPFSITAFQAATGAFDGRFVELQGRLGSVIALTRHRTVFGFHEGEQRFQAILGPSTSGSAVPAFSKESLLRIRGVCVTDSKYTKNLVPFVILLSTVDDVKVISGPPWWSTRSLITGFIAFTFLSLLGYLLYIRVSQWRLRAVIEERLRLAHELHDTLAQSFAGIGYQLRAILKSLPDAQSTVRKQIEITSALVRQGHQEARRSISTLHIGADTLQIELLPALAQAAKRMIGDGSIVVETSVSGNPRHIPVQVTDAIFRMGQEAIANAVRHANASRIHVHLSYDKKILHFIVEDNGLGFTPEASIPDGFGLNGIRTRIHAVGGTVQICSAPGRGARLRADVPLPPPLRLLHLFSRRKEKVER